MEELLSEHREETHTWLILIKDNSVIKIKNLVKKDVPEVEQLAAA